ncbi:S-layer homology domain-containing protein [Tepidibacter thalassicus]|uniref:S-layer homology domain-containing protein n=1 Tax=Tepidibacter thalassicus DSM 15285 TaxID=1123350 RepID=A0A1M5S6B5_9FIRM|nr:S-layer homology domain-containing protein [Tepidibacter thalassicus]SHH33473.1 S-layer homology domain-containing protein [Tepidibacter thalassicus DSM 15285]
MKNTKKVLSVALAGALAFGGMSTAFAAAPEMNKDTDKKVVEAVERLSAFGIVNGMEDGKYHEEMKVTREQFAKILVTALGLSDAADAAKGATKFSDVDGSRWSSGYINVAAGQGLLNGYPDGTFKPTKEVSYAEAVTMLVRALGYKDEFLPGSWPGNYVAKAADTGITSGAKFADANGTADRGTVAVLVDNALDAKVVKVSEYLGGEIKYTESKVTLLKEKLDVNKYEDVRLLADKTVDDSLDKDEVKVKFLKTTDEDDKENVKNMYKAEDVREFDLAEDTNLKPMLGEEVTIYLNDDNEVIYAQRENDDKANFDFIDKVTKDKEISLVKFNDEYEFAKNAVVYVFDDDKNKYKKEVDYDKLKVEDIVGHVGKFVVKNNKIVYAEIKGSGEDAADPWMLVKENKDGVLKGICETDADYELDLSKDGDFKGVLVFDQYGNKMDVKDIEENSLIYAQKQKYEGDDYAVVTVLKENVVKGKLGKVKKDEIEIGGKSYDIASYTDKNGDVQYNAYYSIDKDEHSKAWKTDSDWEKDMEDADDAEMVAYLDATGKIVYLTSEVKETSGYRYGIVTKAYADGDKIEVYTITKDGKGEKVKYNLEEDKDFENHKEIRKDDNGKFKEDNVKGTAIKRGDVVKFKLNKNGEIAEDELYVMDKDSAWTAKDDFGKDSIKTKEGKSFSIDSKTVLINAEGFEPGNNDFDTDDFGIIKWADIKEDASENARFFVFTDDDSDVDAEAVIFIGENGLTSANDEEAIYVIDKWTKHGDTYIEYADEDGKVHEREVYNKDDVEKEDAYIAKVKSDGKIELMKRKAGETVKDYKIVDGKVIEKDGKTIKVKDIFGNTEDYTLKSDTVVYEENSKKSISKIKKGDAVSFIVEDGVSVRVVERLVDDEEDKVIDKVENAEKKDIELASLSDVTVKERATTTVEVTVNPKDVKLVAKAKDESIAEVSVVDGKVSVKGLKEGETTVTVTATKDGYNSAEKTFKVTVEKKEETPSEDDSMITNAEAKGTVATAVSGDIDAKVTKVEVIYDGKTKEAKLADGKFTWNIFPGLDKGDKIIVKAYVGTELKDTDEVIVK